MDIEHPSSKADWRLLFNPFDPSSLASLSKQTPIFQSLVSSAPYQAATWLLTLTQDRLFLSESGALRQVPLASVGVSFDLKFEVQYETQKNVRSSKLGLRFYTEECKEWSCFCEGRMVEQWTRQLGKVIHQKGFHQRFKPLRKLGKGNFATVYEVERIEDGHKFAVKAFSKQSCFSASRGKESLINELSVMRGLSLVPQRNVLHLEGVYESDNSIYVVLELLTGGQLFHRIQERNGNFTEPEVRECMLGLVSGLANMHKQHIMHRDLKPENIMLRSQSSLDPVIVDFGLASNTQQEKYLFYRCGTPGYVAPEIIALTESGHVNPECDMFSVGVIFHILLTRKPLFEGTKYDEVYKKNKGMEFSLTGERYQNVDPQAMDLLRMMLVADPALRIKASAALGHPYLLRREETVKRVASPCLISASSQVRKV